MTNRAFLLLDTVVFFLITWGALSLRHGGLTWPQFRDQLYVFIPIFLLATFVLWLFSRGGGGERGKKEKVTYSKRLHSC